MRKLCLAVEMGGRMPAPPRYTTCKISRTVIDRDMRSSPIDRAYAIYWCLTVYFFEFRPACSATTRAKFLVFEIFRKKTIITSAKIQRGWKEKDSISSVGTERRIQEILKLKEMGSNFFQINCDEHRFALHDAVSKIAIFRNLLGQTSLCSPRWT